MKKTLVFDSDKGAQRFARLYEALIIGSVSPNQERDFDVYRREAKLADAFEAISDPEPSLRPLTETIPARRLHALNGGPPQITVDGADIELLKKRLRLKDFWAAAAVRSVVDAYDWLEHTPED